MPKQRVLLISTLKPADEPRMHAKIGATLARAQYDVICAGNQCSGATQIDGVETIQLYAMERSSFSRLKSFLKAWGVFRRTKPRVVVVCTFELLWISVWYKWVSGARIVYDVQENYVLNTVNSDSPKVSKVVWKWFIQLQQYTTKPWVDYFWLAEEVYQQQLHIPQTRSAVVENKSLQFPTPAPPSETTIIYTGTIADSYGSLEAIDVAEDILRQIPGRFVLAGYAPDRNFLKRVRDRIRANSNMELVGGDTFVRYNQIQDLIASASCAIITYKSSPAFAGKRPTKMYEYLVAGLPILLPEASEWMDLCRSYGRVLPIKSSGVDIAELRKLISSHPVRVPSTYSNLYWKSNEQLIEDSIYNILNTNYL